LITLFHPKVFFEVKENLQAFKLQGSELVWQSFVTSLSLFIAKHRLFFTLVAREEKY